MKVSDGLKFGIGLTIASFVLERIFDILWRMGDMNNKVNALIRKTRPDLSKNKTKCKTSIGFKC